VLLLIEHQVRRRGVCGADVDDCVGEIAQALLSDPNGFSVQAILALWHRPWLIRLVRNHVRRFKRQQAARREEPLELALNVVGATDLCPEAQFLFHQLEADLLEEIRRLPAAQRHALVLYLLKWGDGASTDDLDTLDSTCVPETVSTQRVHLFRARRALRRWISSQGNALPDEGGSGRKVVD
jgi:DNA-directed RNA polymerase specialized sigma24 family protein